MATTLAIAFVLASTCLSSVGSASNVSPRGRPAPTTRQPSQHGSSVMLCSSGGRCFGRGAAGQPTGIDRRQRNGIDQHARIGGGRRGEHPLARPLLDDAAIAHHYHALADRADYREIV